MSEVKDQIQKIVNDNKIVLFMKGTPEMPQCGFSAQVVSILNNQKIKFASVNVLEDETIRQGIKDFSNWPTIPQLYVAGEFIGGCDIITEMHDGGELEQILSKIDS